MVKISELKPGDVLKIDTSRVSYCSEYMTVDVYHDKDSDTLGLASINQPVNWPTCHPVNGQGYAGTWISGWELNHVQLCNH